MAPEAVLERAPFNKAILLQGDLRLPRDAPAGGEEHTDLLVTRCAEKTTRNEDNDRILAELSAAYSFRPEFQFAVNRFSTERGAQRPHYGTMDDINAYTASVDSYRLLEPHEEKCKILEVQKGLTLYRAIAEQGRSFPDKKEEKLLMKAAAAREILYMCNLRLALKFAKSYFSSARPGISELDFIQEANCGLGAAIARFDKDYEFNTYASFLIRNALKRKYRGLSRAIYVPEDKYDALRTVGDASTKISSQLGRSATVGEVAAVVEIDTEEVEVLMRANAANASLDEQVRGMKNVEKGDLVQDPLSSVEIDRRTDEVSDQLDVEKIVASTALTNRELVVLGLHSGIRTTKTNKALSAIALQDLGDIVPGDATYTQIATVIGGTRDKAARIQKGAIAKMQELVGV